MQTQIQTLPYIAPHNPKKSVYRPFSVVVPVDGVEARIGARVQNPLTALRNAQKASIKYGYAEVLDGTRSLNQRLVALFRKGIEVYVKEDLTIPQ